MEVAELGGLADKFSEARRKNVFIDSEILIELLLLGHTGEQA